MRADICEKRLPNCDNGAVEEPSSQQRKALNTCILSRGRRGWSSKVGEHGALSHPGSAATRVLADWTGLTGGLSGELARRGFAPLHDRGRVVTDLAVAIADGATISEISILLHQEELFGLVASDSTAWRALAGCGPAALARIGRARARTRRHVSGT